MRKAFITALAILLTTALVRGQETEQAQDTTGFIYCQIVGTSKPLSSKLIIQIDYGQEQSLWTARQRVVVDEETGKIKSFNSMVDALNYMGSMGWEFVQAYALTMGSTNVYHFLLRRAKAGENYIPETFKRN